jgi:hypothetical protein
VSAPGNMRGECKTRTGAAAFMSNMIPLLSLFFIGYPLGRATIRTMVVGWTLIIVAAIHFILGRYFQTKRSPVRATQFLNRAPK